MKTLNKYPTPETFRLHSKFIADDEMPHLDAFLEMAELAQNLEQRLALCREALAWIAKLYDDSQPIYKVAMDAYSMKSEAANALEATKPKP